MRGKQECALRQAAWSARGRANPASRLVGFQRRMANAEAPGCDFAVYTTGSFAVSVPADAAWPLANVYRPWSQFGVAVWQSVPPAVGAKARAKKPNASPLELYEVER